MTSSPGVVGRDAQIVRRVRLRVAEQPVAREVERLEASIKVWL
jgi:hypothetical protein